MKRLELLFLFFLLLPIGLLAQREFIDSLFIQANNFYINQQYAEASNTYNRILDQGFTHSNLYYNLGNTYYQLGWLGYAIWAYEKGLKLKPGDRDLKFNLKVANARIVDRVEVPEAFFLLKWYDALKRRFSPAQWLNVISLIFLFSGILYIIFRFTLSPLSKLLKQLTVFGIVITFTIGVIFIDRYFEVLEKEEAIVVASEGNVYSTPSNMGNLIFIVHAGTQISVVSSQEPWIEIELIDGKQGWIRSEKIKSL